MNEKKGFFVFVINGILMYIHCRYNPESEAGKEPTATQTYPRIHKLFKFDIF